MTTYVCTIPEVIIEVKARGFGEANAKALEVYEDYKDNDYLFGEFIIKVKQ